MAELLHIMYYLLTKEEIFMFGMGYGRFGRCCCPPVCCCPPPITPVVVNDGVGRGAAVGIIAIAILILIALALIF